MTHTCTDCHQPIPAGLAVLRSSLFRQLPFHRECWAARKPAAFVPAQRTSSESAARVTA
ncbi:MAG TPA: hypothetical protein VFG91_01950 [Woeseiaceae bacterium]|nr:hypothetical protein [Woeseiaceae bacterium]